MERAAESKPKSIVRENAPVQDDPCECKLPSFCGQHIDLIDHRMCQLRGLCGAVISLGSKTDKQDVGILPADLGAVASIVDELLEEIEEHADKMTEHYNQILASRQAGKGRTQPSADAA